MVIGDYGGKDCDNCGRSLNLWLDYDVDEPIEIHGKAKCSECGKITDVTLVSNDGGD